MSAADDFDDARARWQDAERDVQAAAPGWPNISPDAPIDINRLGEALARGARAQRDMLLALRANIA